MNSIEPLTSDDSSLLLTAEPTQFLVGFSPKASGGLYIDLFLTLHMSWASTKDYEYSKLYYNTHPELPFDESRVICFRVPQQGCEQKIRLVLPEEVKVSTTVSFRVDPYPYCTPGSFQVSRIAIIYEADEDVEASRRADLMALKQWTREQVVKCEQLGQRDVQHLPESLCLEITPRCNLTCGHCSTHGTPEAHERHNSQPEIPLTFLDHLAETVFPSLTSITAIGRGEPLYLTDETWDRLVGHIRANHMLFSIVTNGVLLKKRLSPDLIPLIDTITVSIDGLYQETFGENRGGASIDKVLNNVRYYHELRKSFCLPRRPKLCLSWTMKRNNIHEMLEFLEVVKEFEPDIMFTRHLMIFHEKDRHQSLVNDPDYCNLYLEKVYARMKELRIRTECPPVAENFLYTNGQIVGGKGHSQVYSDAGLIAKEADGDTLVFAHSHTSLQNEHYYPPVFDTPRQQYLTVPPTPVYMDFMPPASMTGIGCASSVVRSYVPPVIPLDIRKPPPAQPSKPGELVKVDPCMFVYRTANIHTDGRIHVCPRPNAPLVGSFHEKSFTDIWRGERYQKVRSSLDTENEFHECRYCWYRESKYHPQRFQRDEQSRQNFSLFDPVRYLEKTWDFTLNKIEQLSAINRDTANINVEQQLRELRISCDDAPRPTIAVVPPDLLESDMAMTLDKPDIDASDLSTDLLRSAIQQHRYLIVRNLLGGEQAEEWHDKINMAIAHQTLIKKGLLLERASVWYSRSPFLRQQNIVLTPRAAELTENILAVNSPRMLFNIIELFDDLNLRYLLSRYFGELPVLAMRACLFGKNRPPQADLPWKQERADQKKQLPGLKFWLALSDCGGQYAAPALELPNCQVELQQGDAILFDYWLPHRLGYKPHISQAGYALQSSFFAYSSCPSSQRRIIY